MFLEDMGKVEGKGNKKKGKFKKTARRREADYKNTLIVAAARAAGLIVSIPQSACSALLRGFGISFLTGSCFFVEGEAFFSR